MRFFAKRVCTYVLQQLQNSERDTEGTKDPLMIEEIILTNLLLFSLLFLMVR